jgi:UDP-GlcNAc:undecaprenyl-phosphate GlcNAc-1-phosphate transferase
MLTLSIVLAAGCAAVSFGLCWLARRVAPRIGLLDRPGLHKQHGRVVPYGGGMAMLATICLAFAAAAAVIYLLAPARPDLLPDSLRENLAGLRMKMPQALLMLAGAAALAMLGLIDDYRPLGPITKLIVEFIIAALVVTLLPIRAGQFLHPVLSTCLTIAWVVLMVNSFNFLDNMDGLSGSVAIVCGTILAAAGLVNGQFFVPAMLLLIVGAVAGFLPHNLPPARLFMGDAGSLVLGYFVGLLSVLTTYTQDFAAAPTAVLVPLVVLAVPLYDTFSVCTLRLWEKRELLKGDRSHFSHRLLARGMSGQALSVIGMIMLIELHWRK